MANRFAASDTLGFQLYDKHLREDIARERAEEARREQEKKARKARKKAKKHAGFQQAMRVVGGIAGAAAAPATGGLSLAAGYGLGSAGGGLLANVFPNMAGTKPNDSNPYYEPASGMQIADQSIRTGLQAYGQYNNHLKEEARANLVDFTRSLTTKTTQVNTNGQSTPMGALTEEQYYDEIINSQQYKDAKDIFGENVLSERTVRDIARNTYNSVGDQAMRSLQVITAGPPTTETPEMLGRWYGRYGKAYQHLLPEGMQAHQAAVADKALAEEQLRAVLLAAEMNVEAAGISGIYNPEAADAVRKSGAVQAEILGNALDTQGNAKVNARRVKQEQATATASREAAGERLKESMKVLKGFTADTDKNVVDQWASDTAAVSVAAGHTGDLKEAKKYYANLARIMQTSENSDLEDSINDLADKYVTAKLGEGLKSKDIYDGLDGFPENSSFRKAVEARMIDKDGKTPESWSEKAPEAISTLDWLKSGFVDALTAISSYGKSLLFSDKQDVSPSVSSDNNTVTDSDNATSGAGATTSNMNFLPTDNASNKQLTIPAHTLSPERPRLNNFVPYDTFTFDEIVESMNKSQ